ncbi:MAG TPA: hypothetical protein VGA09_08955, partial [Candidatus Binatia bacterium]
MELLITFGVFGLVSGLVYFLFSSRAPISDEVIQRRLESIRSQPVPAGQFRLYDNEQQTFWERVTDFFFGDKEMPERFNRISRRLHQAGYRGARAVRVFWGLRIFFAMVFGFGLLLLGMLSNAAMKDFLLLGGAGAFAGYMLPFVTVYRKAKARVL